jgi:hypothetical protein
VVHREIVHGSLEKMYASFMAQRACTFRYIALSYPEYANLGLPIGLRQLNVPQLTSRCNPHSHHHDIDDAVRRSRLRPLLTTTPASMHSGLRNKSSVTPSMHMGHCLLPIIVSVDQVLFGPRRWLAVLCASHKKG